jgi:dTDP-3-amino-2,3,6-trideoxy-4-keto-D-glucose/dTDP-3-amino-3,4,6-trideoxy-alpha-D-glucose/dTDP-2,6-dideoxy-D-kanosamine transaminase
MIKSWDYINEYNKIKPQIIKSINNSLSSGYLILGPQLELFEKNFSKFIGTKYGLGVGNCTDAIFIALKALNIGNGDEVITVSNTAIPTVTAIVNSGAKPRFVDVDDNYLMDFNKIESVINKNTKAIIPVHLYGQTCNMNEILKIKKKYNLKIIEDCAQSTGSMVKKKKSGSFGDVGCFSFYPTKILGAYGDAGFLSTNNTKLYNKMRRIRLMGMESNIKSKNKFNKKYYAIEHGTNSRLDEIQASILNVKLNFIEYYINRRRQIAKIYSDNLKKENIKLPKEDNNNFHVYYQYVVRHNNRNLILKKLQRKGINLSITYPYPIHKMRAYKIFSPKKYGKLSKTEKFSNQIFSLPTYPSIKDVNIEKIIKEMNKLI